MHKSNILLLTLVFLNVAVSFASKNIDSIGVENNNGKKVIVHKVDAKETYYAIGKRYNVNYKDVILFNENKALHVGIIVKVPTDRPFEAVPIGRNENASPSGYFEYTIKAKDNLNMLAEKYGTTINEIKRINNLSSINLQIGQVLKIPATGNTPQETAVIEPPVVTKTVIDQKTAISADGQSIEHTIKAKENLNLLAEKYGTTVEEIKALNGLSSNNLRIGQVLKIRATNAAKTVPVEIVQPAPIPSNVYAKPETPSSNIADGSFEHIVLPGETIYSIARKYNLTTYQLKTASNLKADEVTVGQKLIIKGPRSVAAINGVEEPVSNGNTIKDPSFRGAPSSYGIIQMEEKGTAVWIADQDLDPTKMLVLHRSAPVGTIIKVTNPMSNRSAFAKVVGKYTENESTKDVIIVMTKAVADAVGALDKRFFCNLTYGAQENEQ
jgi:peptidoglycan endopeptidase LytF